MGKQNRGIPHADRRMENMRRRRKEENKKRLILVIEVLILSILIGIVYYFQMY